MNNYTLHFSPIKNQHGTVNIVNHSKNQKVTIGVNIKDEDFRYRQESAFPSLIADIIDLAVAISASDRLIQQPFYKTPPQINLILPVRNPDLLNRRAFQDKLEELMNWTTGSSWTFKFKKRIDKKRLVEEQMSLVLWSNEVKEIALWSGGLDALAGLYSRIIDDSQGLFILCGSGSNNKVFDLQKKVFNAIDFLPTNHLKLYRTHIHFSDSKAYNKNSISRARGVVFMLIGSACAYLMKKRVLNIYENGIGAINLPYRRSALGLDHTRSVHPKTLSLTSDLLSTLLDEPFKIQNPFLFLTKAQMCQALVRDNQINLALLTQSCDRHPHQKPSQCGYCSSCLLRKQSLAAAGIEDTTQYFISHGDKPIKQDTQLYFTNMIEQVKTLQRLLSISNKYEQQWEALTNEFTQLDYDVLDYLELSNTNLTRADIQKLLINLYQNYVNEWTQVKSQIQSSLVSQKYHKVASKFSLLHQKS